MPPAAACDSLQSQSQARVVLSNVAQALILPDALRASERGESERRSRTSATKPLTWATA